MTYIKYLKNDKREITGLLGYEKTIIEGLFTEFGDLEETYENVKFKIKRKYRLKNHDIVELLECFEEMGYIKKIGGKKNWKIRILKW